VGFKFFFPVLAIAMFSSELAQATNIGIDLGPAHVLTGINPETNRLPFDGLRGTPLFGQTVSVDFFFAHNGFVRIFTATGPAFDVQVNLQTNGSGLLGFLHGSGYLIDAQGNAIPGFGVTGSASGDDGSLGIGLFPLLKDDSGTPNQDLARPLDFYGVHYDLTLPVVDPSVEVTSGQFLLAGNGIFTPFAIGPGRIPRDIVPDTGSTFMLLLLGFGGVIAARRSRRFADLPRKGLNTGS
jgi:hypothetical protein